MVLSLGTQRTTHGLPRLPTARVCGAVADSWSCAAHHGAKRAARRGLQFLHVCSVQRWQPLRSTVWCSRSAIAQGQERDDGGGRPDVAVVIEAVPKPAALVVRTASEPGMLVDFDGPSPTALALHGSSEQGSTTRALAVWCTLSYGVLSSRGLVVRDRRRERPHGRHDCSGCCVCGRCVSTAQRFVRDCRRWLLCYNAEYHGVPCA
jgi:hypothetical protein